MSRDSLLSKSTTERGAAHKALCVLMALVLALGLAPLPRQQAWAADDYAIASVAVADLSATAVTQKLTVEVKDPSGTALDESAYKVTVTGPDGAVESTFDQDKQYNYWTIEQGKTYTVVAADNTSAGYGSDTVEYTATTDESKKLSLQLKAAGGSADPVYSLQVPVSDPEEGEKVEALTGASKSVFVGQNKTPSIDNVASDQGSITYQIYAKGLKDSDFEAMGEAKTVTYNEYAKTNGENFAYFNSAYLYTGDVAKSDTYTCYVGAEWTIDNKVVATAKSHEWTLHVADPVTSAIEVVNADGGSTIAGGTVAVTVNDEAVTEAIQGSTVKVTATPDENYKLGSISVVDANGNKVSFSSYYNTFTMPGSKATITVTFMPVVTSELKFTEGHGAVAFAIGTSWGYGTETVEQAQTGDRVMFKVTPDSGYQIAMSGTGYDADPLIAATDAEGNNVEITFGWNEAGPHSFTMPGSAVTVTVQYEELPKFQITKASGIENGDISFSSSEFLAGDEIEVTAIPETGYVLDSLVFYDANDEIINTSGWYAPLSYDIDGNKATVSISKDWADGDDGPNCDLKIGATFTAGYTITGGEVRDGSGKLVGKVIPGDAAEGEYSALVKPGNGGGYGYAISLEPEPGYVYKANSLKVVKTADPETDITSEVDVYGPYNNGASIGTMPEYDITVTCEFELGVYTVDASSYIGSNGSVTAAFADDGVGHMGDTVILTVAPDAEYELASLSLATVTSGVAVPELVKGEQDASGHDTYSFVMPNSNVRVIASFGLANRETQEITLSNSSYTVEYGAEAFSLGASLAKTDADGELLYSSSNESVVTVDEDGTASIVGAGTATITVSAPATAAYKAAEDKAITVTVNRARVAADAEPSAEEEELTYNGSPQEGVNYVEDAGYVMSGDLEMADAGTYEAIATLDANHAWSDGSTEAMTISWSIARAAVPAASAPSIVKNLTYKGTKLTGVKAVAGAGYTVSGQTTGTNAGSYEATATLDKNHAWANGKTDELTLNWTIARAKVKAPIAVKNLVYTGTKLTGVKAAANAGYTVKGNTGVNAGTYKAKAVLDKNHVWANGAAGAISLKWTIAKAANKVTAAKAKVSASFKAKKLKKKAQSVALPKLSAKAGKAAWAVQTADKKKVLSLNAKTGKVQVKKKAKKGTYTIKLQGKAAASANYKAAASGTVTVTVKVKK